MNLDYLNFSVQDLSNLDNFNSLIDWVSILRKGINISLNWKRNNQDEVGLQVFETLRNPKSLPEFDFND